MHFIPTTCVADAVSVVVLRVLCDMGMSVMISEPFEETLELFVTAVERVEPTTTVFGVVLGLEDLAENNRRTINTLNGFLFDKGVVFLEIKEIRA